LAAKAAKKEADMRLVTFASPHGDRLGALVKGRVVDLNTAYALYLKSRGEQRAGPEADRLLPSEMIAFLALGEQGQRMAQAALAHVATANSDTPLKDGRGYSAVYASGEVKLGAPIPHPPKVICMGLNYVDHCKESGVPVPTSPFFFIKPWTAVTGPEETVFIPRMKAVNKHVDYELELTIVIGRKGRHVPEKDAYDIVAGYTIMNDISARDFVPPEFLPMKGHNTFAPIGPCITTRDEIGDVDDLDIQLRVNGEVLQNSNTRNFVFKVPQVVSYVSEIVTLEPGDIISTGTPGGVGWKRTPPRWLKPGDIIEAEVENIGILRNRVAAEP
jgi:acylpyruvate hydrolase